MSVRSTPSSATHLVRNILIRHGGFERRQVWLEHPVLSYWLDLYLPDWNVGIEVDGPGHAYSGKQARDGQKARALEAEGIRVLHIPTSHLADYKYEPLLLVEHVRAFLAYKPPSRE